MAENGRGRFDEALLDRLREEHRLSDFFEKCGVQLRRAGREWIGLSPFNVERTPSFTVCDQKGFFHCFSSGMHGDIFDAVQHFKGLDFPGAVNFLSGDRQEVTPEERERIRQRRKEREERERADRQQLMTRLERMWDNARPIIGTYGEDYLAGRGLDVDPSWTFDLRFFDALGYHGFPDEDAKEPRELERFPTMVAAIRDVSGAIIGIHRTYLDPERPVKLTPPGDRRRNRAKKILGDTTGGLIHLSKIGRRVAMGEGIETTRAWFEIKPRDGVTIASAVSLGNLAGAAAGSLPHPEHPKKRIPNGEPDFDRPGVVLPPHVEEAILLGDGDSDPPMTRQRLLVAAKRFRSQGRDVFVHMAAPGKDFNDMLREARG